MKLSLSRHSRCSAEKTPWIDRRLIGVLGEIAVGLDPPEEIVEVIIVDDDYIRDINRNFRGQDAPTDVISFSYAAAGQPSPPSDDVWGEIYVSHETVARNADDLGVVPGNLFLRVGVHGLLHVVGYEHSSGGDARRMETEEKRLLLEHLNPAEVEELF